MEVLSAGLATGAPYGLLALGLALIYRATAVINFAHGTSALAAVYLCFALEAQGWTRPLAWVLALLLSLIIASINYYLCEKAQKIDSHGTILVTFALAMSLEGLLQTIFGGQTQAYRHYFEELPGWIDQSIFFSASALALFGYWLLKKSRFGLALHLASSSPQAALQIGLPVSKLKLSAWWLAAILAWLSGLLLVPKTLLEPGLMLSPLLKAFVLTAILDFQSILRVYLLGLGLGLLESLVANYLGAEHRELVSYGLILSGLAFFSLRRGPYKSLA